MKAEKSTFSEDFELLKENKQQYYKTPGNHPFKFDYQKTLNCK